MLRHIKKIYAGHRKDEDNEDDGQMIQVGTQMEVLTVLIFPRLHNPIDDAVVSVR